MMPLDNFLSKCHLEEWNNTQQRKCILDFTVARMTQANQKTRTYGKFLKTIFSSTIRQRLEWSALTTVVMSTSSKFLLNTRKGVFTYQDGPHGLFIKLVGKSYQPEKIQSWLEDIQELLRMKYQHFQQNQQEKNSKYNNNAVIIVLYWCFNFRSK